jgi:hypothetical protein
MVGKALINKDIPAVQDIRPLAIASLMMSRRRSRTIHDTAMSTVRHPRPARAGAEKENAQFFK